MNSTIILIQNGFRFELFEPYSELDEMWKLIVYDIKTNLEAGHITFLLKTYPGMYDYNTDGFVAEIVDNFEPMCLEYLVVEPEYRLKGLGKFLLSTFINYIVQDNICILLKASFGVNKQLQELLDNKVLPKFYESFGFKKIEPSHNYYVLNL